MNGTDGDKVFADTFAFASTYSSWISHDIMGRELVRNMLLAAGCVFAVVLLLIACLQTCVLVLTCVALTLVSLRIACRVPFLNKT
jgi:hypothetical protein